MTYIPRPIPSFEFIKKLGFIPYDDLHKLTLRDLCRHLNKVIEDVIGFGENGFSVCGWLTGIDPDLPIGKWEKHYRWLEVCSVRGSNEGYYLHLTMVPHDHSTNPSILLATAKTYDCGEALCIAAIAARLLDDA